MEIGILFSQERLHCFEYGNELEVFIMNESANLSELSWTNLK